MNTIAHNVDINGFNRVNGKDGPIPNNCAKCKRTSWDGMMSSKEIGLRVRLYKFEGYPDGRQYRPNALCEKFLSLNPRPTMQELRQALCPLGWDPHKHRNKVPDSEKPGYLKYDSGRWKKLSQDWRIL